MLSLQTSQIFPNTKHTINLHFANNKTKLNFQNINFTIFFILNADEIALEGEKNHFHFNISCDGKYSAFTILESRWNDISFKSASKAHNETNDE